MIVCSSFEQKVSLIRNSIQAFKRVMEGYKVVMTYGTFDTLHYGHIELLRRAKTYGDYLIVAVSTDEFNKTKGKEAPRLDFDTRCRLVSSIKYVDSIIPETCWGQKESDFKLFDVDTLVMGDDWEGVFDQWKDLVTVVTVPRTKYISSSMIKELRRT